MFTSVSADVGDLPPLFPCFFSMILNLSNFSLNLFAYFFCSTIMAGEPTHATSKERMVPDLMFSSERAPQLSKTALKV